MVELVSGVKKAWDINFGHQFAGDRDPPATVLCAFVPQIFDTHEAS
jgi:hypothetical protein